MSLPQTQPTLPTPRAVITSLINSLTSAPLPAIPPQASPAYGRGETTNPLKSLPQSRRPLLVTLHVLFPSLVLPALDLLDRNLVTRVVPEDGPTATTTGGDDDLNPAAAADPAAEGQQPAVTATTTTDGDQDADDQRGQPPAAPNRRGPAAAFHLVRSVASTMSRRATSATTYLVHLDAWNCTCANFAFEAFPVAGGAGHDLEILRANADAAYSEEAPPNEWQFGGLSLDGRDHGGVPCCKHLLACLLSEHWGSVLGSYVTERRVSPEEMAGLVADV